VPIVLKSGILNLPEPSGPVKACNGIALPFNTVTLPVGQIEVNTELRLKFIPKIHLNIIPSHLAFEGKRTQESCNLLWETRGKWNSYF
jgi:hypothetical protein